MTAYDNTLDDLFGGPTVPRTAPAVTPPATYTAPTFTESCVKCGGTGNWRPGYPCFACKGKGKKVFKNSAADRAHTRELSEARKERNRASNWTDFVAANPVESTWLLETAGRWDLAAKFMEAIMQYGDLTEKQMAVVRNGVARDEARKVAKAAAVTNAPAVDASALEDAFKVAKERAARPGQMGVMVKPLRMKSGDVSLRIRPGSEGSQWEGMLFAKTDDGKKLGYIKRGQFIRNFACSDVEAEAVLACAAAPRDAVFAYAKAWSKCSICGRGLLNDVSIERGIGPICLGKFGW